MFLGFWLPADLVEEGVGGLTVFDVGAVALVPVGFFTVGGVEDGGDVRLDGETAVVAVVFEFGEDFTDFALSCSGEGVFGGFGFALGRIGAVFDMHVDDVFFDGAVEFERVLPGEGFRFGAVALEDGVGGVEDEFETGDFFDEA